MPPPSTSTQVRQRASMAASSLAPSHASRPLRSSPLAGPAFSTLPSIISESSEESHVDAFGEPSHHLARSTTSSIVSHSPSASGSGYGTVYTSGNASHSIVEGEASTSSFSLSVSGNGFPSSQGHGEGHNYRAPPSRPSKSAGPVPTLGFFRRAATTSPHSTESPMSAHPATPAIPPAALTHTRGHFRSASLPSRSLLPTHHPSIPQTYSPGSPRPTSPTATLASSHPEPQTRSQRPSTSRDPTSNWLTSSPFGPAETPRFSRLALASPTVVMPLSAREYRKRKSSGLRGKGKESVSTTHVSFVDTTRKHVSMPLPASSGVSPSTLTPTFASTGPEDPLSSPSPLPPAGSESKIGPSLSFPEKSSPSPNQPRSRPATPHRSPSPQVPYSLSPKSSTNTFFSVASSSSAESEVIFPCKNINDNLTICGPTANEEIDCILPAARPRPRPRRNRSFPDRRSGSARLSLVDAMNRLSQEGTLNRLSAVSQTNSHNRLSVVSQASGNTAFYDFSDVENKNQENVPVVTVGERASVVVRSQSLEDLSSTLTRTRFETIERDAGRGHDVRTVRISENVDMMRQPTSPRRRKLTKSRPQHVPPRTLGSPLRALTVLPWISRGSVGEKTSAEDRADEEVRDASSFRESVESPGNALAHPKSTGDGLSPITKGSTTHEDERLSANDTVGLLKNPVNDAASPVMGTPLRRRRRYTFQIIPAPSFHRTRRDKASSVCDPPVSAPSTELDGRKKLAKLRKKTEKRSSTDNAGGTAGKQDSVSTLVAPLGSSLPAPTTRPTDVVSPEANNNIEVIAFSHSSGATGGESTPSLTPSGSTTTTSSTATTIVPVSVRAPASSFVPRPSQLKECFTDTSEDDAQAYMNVCPSHHQGGRSSDIVPLFTDTTDGTRLHVCTSPRPGSSSSTTTTATTASYASFSTIAASAHSSSSSPSIIKEREQTPQMETRQEMRPCALCGHPTLLTKHGGGAQDDLHPMFTVPLVTVTASSTSQVHLDRAPSATTKTSGRNATAVLLPTSRTSGKPRKAQGPVSPTSIIPSFLPAGQPVPSLVDTPTLSARRKRPHTAPAGTGDPAVRFLEAIRAREVSEISGTESDGVQYGRGMQRRAERVGKSGGESKLRSMLRGWLGKA